MNTLAELKRANQELQRQLSEAQEALSAIREGHGGSIVVDGERCVRDLSLTGAETVYRLAVETMSEAALNVTPDGRILFCNARFSEFVATPLEQVISRHLADFVGPEDGDRLRAMLEQCARQPVKQRVVFRAADGIVRPMHLTGQALVQPGAVSLCLVAADLSELEASARQIDLLREHQIAMEKEQAELRASKDQYHTLFASMTEGFALHEVIVDDNGVPCDYRFLDINQSFEMQTGLKRSDVVGKRVSEVLPGIDPYWIEIYGKVALTGASARFERYSSELRRWYSVLAYRTVPRQFAVIFTDVTDQRQAGQVLETAHTDAINEKNRLEAIMEALPVGLCIVDPQGGNVRCNPAYERVWGDPLPTPHVVANYDAYKAWWADTGQPLRPEDWASARAVQKGETVVGQLLQIARFDGTRAFVLNSAAPIFDAGRQVVGGAVAIMDITSQVEVQEALRETRDYLQNLIDFANAPIIVWDPAFRITRFNRAFELLTGRRAHDVIGSPLSILFPEETREEASALLQRTQTGERWETVEIPILRLDGSVRTVLWNSATLYAQDGRTVTATIAQGQDITDRKQAEEDRARYLKSLEFIADSATGFLRGQTHPEVFDYIAQKTGELVVDGLVIVTEYDGVNASSTVRAIGGYHDRLHSIPAALRGEVIGLRLNSDAQARRRMIPGTLVELEGGIRAFSPGDLPEAFCRHVEEALGLRRVSAIPFVWKDDCLGAVVILTKGTVLGNNVRVIETFVSQAAIALNRLRTDESLRQREHEYRTLMEDASDGIILADSHGRVLAANSKACELAGYARNEFHDLSVSELMLPEEIPLLSEHMMDIASGRSAIVEHRLRRNDGTYLYVETSARKLADGRYQAILRDITDRKRAEEEFARAVQSEVFEKLFQTLRELHHGEGLAMNLHRIALFAKNYDLLLGEPAGPTDTVGDRPQNDTAHPAPASARARLEYAVREYITGGHERLREIASLLGAVESEMNQKASPAEHPVSAADILTRSDCLEADLREMLRAVQRQRDEVTGASTDLGERIAEHVEVIFHSVARIRRQLNVHYTSNVSEVIRTIVPSFQSAYDRTTIETQEESSDIKAIASPADLGEVLSILITNALEAPAARGEAEKRIVVRLRVDNSRARIDVEDNGQGVKEEIRERIFNAGVTTKASGHGYGLSFARKRLKKYGGTLTYDERFKEGARFVIELVLA